MERALDGDNQPIYGAEYAGYEDNGTPDDESDDEYIYYIKHHVLTDVEGDNATFGDLTLYDPEMVAQHTWNMNELDEVDPAVDTLDASVAGVYHQVIVPVPVSMMPYAGTYRFVPRYQDNHEDTDRAHINRWPKEVNGEEDLPSYVVGYSEHSRHGALANIVTPIIKNMGYRGLWPVGQPQGVLLPCSTSGTGTFEVKRGQNEDPQCDDVIRTLGRTKTSQNGCLVTQSDIWVHYGHANPNMLSFNKSFEDNQSYDGAITKTVEDEPNNVFNIHVGNWATLGSVKLAFLSGCSTAGNDSTPKHLSISQAFVNKNVTCVIGFFGDLETDTTMAREMNKMFWHGLYTGRTVQDSYKFAKDHCKAKGVFNNTFFRVEFFGDTSITLRR